MTALLDELEHDYPIDHRRIAAAGISNGAIFSERLGCDLTARFTAIVAVAGTLAADYAPQCHPSRPISVLLFSGDADPLVPYNGGKIADSDGGTVLSVADTVTFWSRVDSCTGTQTVQELPQLAPHDPTHVTRISSGNCSDGSSVILYSIAHGGHTWPDGLQYLPRFLIGPTTRQIDASAILLRFILDHPRFGG